MFRRIGISFVLFISFFSTNAWAANPQWVQVRSQNFTVLTDAGDKRGRDVALHFEQMRAVFGTLFNKAKVTSSQPMYILAFRNAKEFRNVCPLWKGKAEELAGYFQQGYGVTYIALDLSSENKWEVVFHEYGHFLLNSNSTEMPLWFDEGFAQFFQTVKVEGKDFIFGDIPEGVAESLQQYKWLPIDQLFAVGHDSPYYNESNRQTIFYAESWLAFTHYWFYSPMQNQMVRYLQIEGPTVPPAQAIQEAFGMDARALDRDLEKFYRTARPQSYKSPMPPGIDNMPMTATAMDDVDARARVAELKLQLKDRQAEAAQEFEQIIKEKPEQPVALRGLAFASFRQGDKQKAAEYFRRAAATQSDDAHVYFFSAVLASELGAQQDPALLAQMRKDLQRAVQLDPSSADAYGWLALTYTWQQKKDEAIAPAEKAVELSPRNDRWAMNLAGFYAYARRYDDAIKVCQRLLNSDNPAVASQANSMMSSLKQYKEMVAKYGQQGSNAPGLVVADEGDNEAMTTASSGQTPFDDKVLSLFSGTLANVTCSGKKAVFTVTSEAGVLLLSTDDVYQVSFSGKGKFSCDLHNVPVKGFYSQGKPNQVVALEFQ